MSVLATNSNASGHAGRRSTPSVLLVGSGLGGGGAETRCRLLAQHLFGGTVDVAVMKSDGAAELSQGQRLIDLGWSGGRSLPVMLRRLRQAVRARRYDAVLAMGLYPNTLAWLSVARGTQRSKLIMTEITRPHVESRFGGIVRHLVTHAVRRSSYPVADLCGANSIDGLEEIVRHYGVPRQKIRRLPNLVVPERLMDLSRAPTSTASPGTLSISMVARLDPLKRIDTVIDAVAGLPSDLPWHVDILGDGPHRGTLEAQMADAGLRERVTFHGWTKNPYPAIARATVTVLSSSYEGFSNAVLESMVLGTPVVTSLCSADAEDMGRKGAALVFPIGDAAGLRSHLLRVLTEPALRADLARRASAYAEEHHLHRAIHAYEALVMDALQTETRRG